MKKITHSASGSGSDPLLAVPSVRGDRAAEGRYRSPHVADLVAAELRRRILDGELDDGDELPRQEDLLKEFGVSKPSMREALRILESEGLLSVRRGKVGGAVVHRPGQDNAAYTLGMVLRSLGVPVDDVSMALNILESQCVALCAGREDRLETVVPRLRDVQDRATACIDDVREFTIVSRGFHEEIVALCGSPTLTLVVGALESVWTAHANAWAAMHAGEDDFPDIDYRRQGLDDHATLLQLIEDGDVVEAVAESHRHLAWSPVYTIDENRSVFPSLLAERAPRT
ncbi:MAG: GntR family transcriptional repressor for pyruvate dehydrogenase complex [Candidatus Aldehydirespiratoraceae bacterium]|jgi:GntR family transcriptional repressor for pyruvate dehydrogenase complex